MKIYDSYRTLCADRFMMSKRRRLERLERGNVNNEPLATIPESATLEEAARIYESNLKLLRPLKTTDPANKPAMKSEEATAIYNRYFDTTVRFST